MEAAGERAGHRGHRRPAAEKHGAGRATSPCRSRSTTTRAGGCWRGSTTSASPCATPTTIAAFEAARPARPARCHHVPIAEIRATDLAATARRDPGPDGIRPMNKSQLVDALAARLGDRRTAASAVDGLLETIVDTVAVRRVGVAHRLRGLREPRPERPAPPATRAPARPWTCRPPRCPAFRPGTGFRHRPWTATARAAPPARRPPPASPRPRRRRPPRAPRRRARQSDVAAEAAKKAKAAAKAGEGRPRRPRRSREQPRPAKAKGKKAKK